MQVRFQGPTASHSPWSLDPLACSSLAALIQQVEPNRKSITGRKREGGHGDRKIGEEEEKEEEEVEEEEIERI